MTTKVEDLTNEQLDVLCAEKVMKWVKGRKYWFHHEHPDAIHGVGYTAPGHNDWDIPPFSPTTNIAQALEVDKPDEWRWWTVECTMVGRLIVSIWAAGQLGSRIALVEVHLDPDNKTAAYCRGRCICALKACGVMEI